MINEMHFYIICMLFNYMLLSKNMKQKTTKNYVDITKIMYKYATPKSHNIIHAKKFITDDSKVFIVENKKNGVLFQKDYNDYKDSKKCSKLLRQIFGGKIVLQPVVKCADNVKTCDFKWIRPNSKYFEKWDLKTVEGSSNTTLDNMIKSQKNQSDNFIFDIKNHTISEEQAKVQIINIFNNPYRDWINIIMLKDNKRIIFIYKKMRHHPANAE